MQQARRAHLLFLLSLNVASFLWLLGGRFMLLAMREGAVIAVLRSGSAASVSYACCDAGGCRVGWIGPKWLNEKHDEYFPSMLGT